MESFALLAFVAATVLLILPVASFIVALRALERAKGRGAQPVDDRVRFLESEVEALRRRLSALEREGRAAPQQQPEPATAPSPQLAAPPTPPPAAAARPGAPAAPAAPARQPAPRPAPAREGPGLEQVIGARWATWIGVLAIVFAVGFLLRWTFQNNVIGPVGRVGLGIAAGLGLLIAGTALRRRGGIAYLSEGLAGGGLACLYLSLFAAHQVYKFLDAAPAFGLMAAVTVVGILVSVVTERQATAVLSVLGGLLTPILVTTQHPDERVLLGYLLVLDGLVLGVSRFKAWPALNRLAWVGSILLYAPLLADQPAAAHPAARLVLLTALFVLFVAVPILRPWLDRVSTDPLDLALIVGNGAAYFAAAYVTLERWESAWEGPWAVFLAAFYVVVALAYARRVPKDDGAIAAHLGAAFVAFASAFPLAFDGPWVTLSWAVQGAVLLAIAPKLVRRSVAVWGGLALFALAVTRTLLLDPMWYPSRPPVWNMVYAVGLAVVAALAWAGYSVRPLKQVSGAVWTGAGLRSGLWFLAAGVLGALLWREPTGLWPGVLLTLELVAVAALARPLREAAFVAAAVALTLATGARLFIEDHDLAARAAAQLLNAPLALRIGACAAAALAGLLIRKSDVDPQAESAGQALGATAGLGLLLTLSLGWTMHWQVAIGEAVQTGVGDALSQARWKLQVGLSILWTVYAACALAVGFLRDLAAIRYAALALFGVTIVKVFLVDMANVGAVYRILSFLVLGVVLLAVSYLYQRRTGVRS